MKIENRKEVIKSILESELRAPLCYRTLLEYCCTLHSLCLCCRRKGWVRIFPTADTWNNYGALLEYSSSNNLILHEHLFPDVMMKPANRVRSRFKEGFNEVRKRSQSAGPGKFDKRAGPVGKEESFDKGPKSPKLRAEEEGSEEEEKPKKPSPGELRVAQYEKHLDKGNIN